MTIILGVLKHVAYTTVSTMMCIFQALLKMEKLREIDVFKLKFDLGFLLGLNTG